MKTSLRPVPVSVHDALAEAAYQCLDARYTPADARDLLLQSMVQQAIDACSGNKSQAARLLGIHRNNVIRWASILRAATEDPELHGYGTRSTVSKDDAL